MNVKQTVKKMSAVLTGAAMLGATVVGAMALTLDDYPMPLVEDGVFNGKIVVGKEAATSDVLGAIDIAASLQADSKVAASVSGGTVSVEGGEDFDETDLGAYITAVNLTDTDLAGFVDTDTDFNDDNIDYHDMLILGASGVGLATSGTSGEEDFEDTIYMVVADNGIEYRVYFDDYVNITNVGTTSSTDELKFKFLGRELEVIDVDTDGLGFTVRSAAEFALIKGDSVTVDGIKVTLAAVGSDSVRVTAGGETKVIGEGDNEDFDNGLEIEVEDGSVFYEENGLDNGATLRIGADVEEDAQDGDPMETFGEPDSRSDAEWVWNIDMSGVTAGSQFVGALYNQDRTEIDDDFPALAVGEELLLPNNYGAVSFEELEEKGDYTTLQIDMDDFDLAEDNDGDNLENAKGLYFSTLGGKDVFKVGSTSTEEVWLVDNGGTTETWYADGSDEVNGTGNAFTIEIDDDAVTVTVGAAGLTGADGNNSNESNYVKMAFAGSGDALWLYVDVNQDANKYYFGEADDEESTELKYHTGGTFASASSIGNSDYDYVTEFGAIIPETENQFGSGSSFEMMLPPNQQKGTIVVTSTGSTVSEDAGEGGAYTVNGFALGAGVLDVNAGDLLGETPLLVVGGPYVNTIAKDLMGNPSGDQIMQFFEAGKAKIKLYEDENAILVAGYSAQDTLGASYVLADYMSYDFEGMSEVEVLVASLEDLEVAAPTLPSSIDDLEVEAEEVVEEDMPEEEPDTTA